MANPKAEGSPVIDGTFGAPLYSGVIQLLEAREKVFGKENKSPRELQAIHSNTPWVMFRSGADILTGPNSKVGDSAKAKNCVFYGMLGNTEGPHKPYYWSENLGLRPVAGITGVDVDCKDQYGAVLEATVNLKVFSREALEDIDALYFKPGMPALLEFGHSVYIDKDGTVKNFSKDQALSDDVFFKTGKDFTSVAESVRLLRANNLNYEGLFGYITNFSWNLQKDGSYDCSVKMLSSGTVLKGLQLGETDRYFTGVEQESDEDSVLATSVLLDAIESNSAPAQVYSYAPVYGIYASLQRSKKELLGFMNSITPGFRANEIKMENNVTLAVQQYPTVNKTSGGGNGQVFGIKESVIAAQKGTEFFKNNFREIPCISVTTSFNCGFIRIFKSSKDYTLQYVTLRDVLYILEFFNINRYSTGDGLVRFNKIAPYRYVNVPGTFSLRPTLAAKPYISKGSWDEFGVLALQNADLEVTPSVLDPRPGNQNRILNIWVSLEELASIVKSVVEGNKDNYTILEIVEAILADIQKAFGNINDFRLYRNHVLNVWEIVDYNHIDAGGKIPEIRITGTKNTVKEFDIHSDVSDDLANQMSVAAQASAKGGDTGATAQELVHWNENSIARFTWPKTKSGDGNGDAELEEAERKREEEKEASFWKSVGRLYAAMNNMGGWQSAGSSSDTAEQRGQTVYEEIQAHGCQYFQKLVNQEYLKAQKTKKCAGEMQNGIIPYKTSLTMKGLGGMVIGTTFKMNQNVLPKKYSNWGNIVTGIKHKIDSSGWWTTVDTCYWPCEIPAGGADSSIRKFTNTEAGGFTRSTEYWASQASSDSAGENGGGVNPNGGIDYSNLTVTDASLTGKLGQAIVVAHATGAKQYKDPGDQLQIEVGKGNPDIGEVHTDVFKDVTAVKNYGSTHFQRVWRCKDPYIARLAAEVAIQAAGDVTVGYNTPKRQSDGKLIGSLQRRQTFAIRELLPGEYDRRANVETDCSAFVHTCYMIANEMARKQGKKTLDVAYNNPCFLPPHGSKKGITPQPSGTDNWGFCKAGGFTYELLSNITNPTQLQVGDCLWKVRKDKGSYGHGAMIVGFK